MLDTNVFNHVIDGSIDLAWLKGKCFLATHIQRDELANTPDQVRRDELLATFELVIEDQVSTESSVWGVSRWGKSKWGSNDNKFSEMLAELNSLNKSKANNSKDILIAETALRNGLILITSDKDLFFVSTKFGIPCANAFILQVKQDG